MALTSFCELKIDGVAVALVYEDGRYVRGATRGDGVEGEDVTANIRTIRSVPMRLREAMPPKLLEVRGEVYLPVKPFEEFNRELEEQGKMPFANPRNAAAGTLRQKDPRVTASRPLRYWVHGIGALQGKRFARHSESLAYLREFGLRVADAGEVANSPREIYDYTERSLKKRHELGLPLILTQPLSELPDDTRRAYEDAYIEAAREVGELYLNAGDIARSWPYFRAIGETGPVARAIEKAISIRFGRLGHHWGGVDQR